VQRAAELESPQPAGLEPRGRVAAPVLDGVDPALDAQQEAVEAG
jgi:hypothetical protein